MYINNEIQNRNIQLPADCYKVLSDSDIQTIMHDLTVKHELPLRFTYVGAGAERWDAAINGLTPEKQRALLPDFTGIIGALQQHIGDKPANVIDLGPGNGLQAKELLEFLLSKEQLHNYVAVDISPQMLDITADNIRDWTSGQVHTIKHVRDFINTPLDDIFSDKRLGDNPRIILMLGGTFDNDGSPISALSKVATFMWPGDVLAYDVRTPENTQSSRQEFNLSARHSFLLELLGIPRSAYKAVRTYDADTHVRIDQIIPLSDISLTYIIDATPKHALLKKDEPITIWRYHSVDQNEATANLQQSGLTVVAVSGSEQQRHLLFLCTK
jgi:rhodanese-related sulfurtransferase